MKTPAILITILLAASLFACSPAPTPAPSPTLSQPPAPSATPAPTVSALDEQRTLTVGEMQRSYLIHIPAGLDSSQPAALVFAFHGFQENSASIQRYTGFDTLADENSFIVVYPDGSGPANSLSWNGSGCCGYALENEVDEPAFVNAILADVETLARVDRKRIYASGFSNGALLSYRLACIMADTFAAVAPVGGVLMETPCQPQQPVSLIHVHGVKDLAVPLQGSNSGILFPPVESGLITWAGLNGCDPVGQSEQETVLTHTRYSGCADGHALELYLVEGTGHNWPSPYVAPVSQIIWDFFAAHPNP